MFGLKNKIYLQDWKVINMDSLWLNQDEIDALLGIDKTQKNYDSNWENLKRERKMPFEKTVKTQTPTLLEFENNYAFTYRRFDGAHWHTELREIDTKYKKVGLTSTQRQLKENIDTIMVLKDFGGRIQWITPIIKACGSFDPRYQLLRLGTDWMICIDNSIYETSNRRRQESRNYTEITFSTKKQPVFTIDSTEAILDRIIK